MGLRYFKYQGKETLMNGVVYYNPHTCHKFVLIYVQEHKYEMLNVNKGAEWPTAPLAQGDKHGNLTFTEQELIDKFHANDWEVLEQHLEIVDNLIVFCG